MNMKKFILATIGVFVFIFEMLWHGFLMKDMYEATMSIWRPEEESDMRFIFASQFLFSIMLVYIYTIIGKHITCKRGMVFGLFAGLLMAMPELGTYCYLPIPLSISLMWMLATLLKGLGSGIVVAAIYKEQSSTK
jgi:hypothetical protein